MPSGTTIWALRQSRAQAEQAHAAELAKIKAKGPAKVKIAFVMIHASVWKYDELIERLKISDWAQPMLIIAPYVAQGRDKMVEELQSALTYAKNSGLPFYIDQRLLDGAEPNSCAPDFPEFDIVFFSNPHPLTSPPYHSGLYMNHLSCYVPYSYGMGYLNCNFDHYNQEFHNCMWRIFVPMQYHKKVFTRSCAAGSQHVRVVGYPGIHDLLIGKRNEYQGWIADGRKRIIWAPHHTIAMQSLPLSNFLLVKDHMLAIKRTRAKEVEWAFRPHPLLKFNLIHIAGWTPFEVDAYWKEWSIDSHVSEGEYVALFSTSDAIVHDSASFLVEYLYTQRPALYLDLTGEALGCMNEVGAKAYDCYEIARVQSDIDNFVDELIHNDASLNTAAQAFIASEVLTSATVSPETAIVMELIHSIEVGK